MPPLRIRIFGDPVLRERAAEVTEFDEALRRLAADLRLTLGAAGGAAIAANQVGVLKRLFVWASSVIPEGDLVNPEIVELSEELELGEEGCLSFPGLFYPTKRPLRAHLQGYDIHGEPIHVKGEGIDARMLLHELDHLNGILFIDHLARHDRKEAMRRIRRGELDLPGQSYEGPVI
ncbi:MAG: peptide deformylase [Egibacteraceae bacterium]